MQYMLPLDEVDETHATFRLPPPVVDIHAIMEPVDEGGPVEVKMRKDEWWSVYGRTGDISVDVTPAELLSHAEISEEMFDKVFEVTNRLKKHGENEGEAGVMFEIFADQLLKALEWPKNVRRDAQ